MNAEIDRRGKDGAEEDEEHAVASCRLRGQSGLRCAGAGRWGKKPASAGQAPSRQIAGSPCPLSRRARKNCTQGDAGGAQLVELSAVFGYRKGEAGDQRSACSR